MTTNEMTTKEISSDLPFVPSPTRSASPSPSEPSATRQPSSSLIRSIRLVEVTDGDSSIYEDSIAFVHFKHIWKAFEALKAHEAHKETKGKKEKADQVLIECKNVINAITVCNGQSQFNFQIMSGELLLTDPLLTERHEKRVEKNHDDDPDQVDDDGDGDDNTESEEGADDDPEDGDYEPPTPPTPDQFVSTLHNNTRVLPDSNEADHEALVQKFSFLQKRKRPDVPELMEPIQKKKKVAVRGSVEKIKERCIKHLGYWSMDRIYHVDLLNMVTNVPETPSGTQALYEKNVRGGVLNNLVRSLILIGSGTLLQTTASKSTVTRHHNFYKACPEVYVMLALDHPTDIVNINSDQLQLLAHWVKRTKNIPVFEQLEMFNLLLVAWRTRDSELARAAHLAMTQVPMLDGAMDLGLACEGMMEENGADHE